MKKRLLCLLLSLCLLCACKSEADREEPVTCVHIEDCFLCGRGETAPWGQNNVALISLNTFDMVPVEINRYGEDGIQVKENTGAMTMRRFPGQEGGFQAVIMEDPDRGYASLTVALGEDGAADREKAAAFLCRDCLEHILPEGEGEQVGLGAVYLAAGEIRAFDKQTAGFGLGDFYIHCDWTEGEETLKLMVFYSPLRYGPKT